MLTSDLGNSARRHIYGLLGFTLSGCDRLDLVIRRRFPPTHAFEALNWDSLLDLFWTISALMSGISKFKFDCNTVL
jgi:hypothetical protein